MNPGAEPHRVGRLSIRFCSKQVGLDLGAHGPMVPERELEVLIEESARRPTFDARFGRSCGRRRRSAGASGWVSRYISPVDVLRERSTTGNRTVVPGRFDRNRFKSR